MVAIRYSLAIEGFNGRILYQDPSKPQKKFQIAKKFSHISIEDLMEISNNEETKKILARELAMPKGLDYTLRHTGETLN